MRRALSAAASAAARRASSSSSSSSFADFYGKTHHHFGNSFQSASSSSSLFVDVAKARTAAASFGKDRMFSSSASRSWSMMASTARRRMARDHLQNRPKRIGEDVIFTNNNNRKREFFTRGEPRGTYDYSRYRSTRSDTSVVWLLIGANAMVYLAWQEPENFRTMRTHFLVSESALANGYWHTALTAAFSHNSFNHLFGNMFTLYFFGRDVALACGGAYLLNLYLVGGVVASLAHVGYERYERRKRKPHVGFFDKREHDSFFSWFDERMDKIARLAAPASLGASGAVNAIIAMSVLMMPHRKIYLYGILPLESWVFGAIFLLRDYIGLGTNDGVGHSAHLGGAATGALAFLLRNGRMMR
jgi:membrane associated rhomboid family serine protease